MNDVKTYSIEYEEQGKIFVVERDAYDAEDAKRQFRRDYPQYEIRNCYTEHECC